jgi:hypothetical protein
MSDNEEQFRESDLQWIREHAYVIWEGQGGSSNPTPRALDNWIDAKNELWLRAKSLHVGAPRLTLGNRPQ